MDLISDSLAFSWYAPGRFQHQKESTFAPLIKQELSYFGMMEKVAGLNWAIAKTINKIDCGEGE